MPVVSYDRVALTKRIPRSPVGGYKLWDMGSSIELQSLE